MHTISSKLGLCLLTSTQSPCDDLNVQRLPARRFHLFTILSFTLYALRSFWILFIRFCSQPPLVECEGVPEFWNSETNREILKKTGSEVGIWEGTGKSSEKHSWTYWLVVFLPLNHQKVIVLLLDRTYQSKLLRPNWNTKFRLHRYW